EAAAPGCRDRGSGGKERRLVRRLGADGVRVEVAACRLHAFDQRARVAAQDVLDRRRATLDERKALVEDGDALLRLGMVPGRVEIGEGAVAYELDDALTTSRISASGRSPRERPIR